MIFHILLEKADIYLTENLYVKLCTITEWLKMNKLVLKIAKT